MINLYKCSCIAKNKDAPVYLSRMCVCPKTYAVIGIGKVILSFRGKIPVVRMLWWYKPKQCPPFTKKAQIDSLYIPIFCSQAYKIVRRKQGRK